MSIFISCEICGHTIADPEGAVFYHLQVDHDLEELVPKPINLALFEGPLLGVRCLCVRCIDFAVSLKKTEEFHDFYGSLK